MNAATSDTVRPGRILIARHPTYKKGFYDILLKWLAQNFPDVLGLFQMVEFPAVVTDWSRFILHVPWLQDPVQAWCQKTYSWAVEMTAKCDQRGIPIINRVDRLTNAAKFAGARAMQSAGIATPKMALIENAQEFRETLLGIPLPLLVREDWGHWGKMHRADTIEAARAIPLDEFARPLAMEVIDVRDPRDGLYRKFRYIAAGETGVGYHIHISDNWITRGQDLTINDETRREELEYVARQDPHHELFQRARKAMGLDFVAFDYGYDHTGRMVVWEANPFPLIKFSVRRPFRNHCTHRTLCSMVALYLGQAGLAVPEAIEQGLIYRDGSPVAT
jgi:hypothetical protein